MDEAAEPTRQSRWALATLLAANLIPLFGVLFFKWDLAAVLLLYWAETAVIGFYNIFKILRVGGLGGIPVVLFFCFHFGMFMSVHLVFLMVYLGGIDSPLRAQGPSPWESLTWGWALALLSLVVSHGVSYVRNFLGKREWEGRTVQDQMGAPYGRVIVMHLAILFGGFFVMSMGQPVWLLVLLVAGKIAIDVGAHLRSHRGDRSQSVPARIPEPE